MVLIRMEIFSNRFLKPPTELEMISDFKELIQKWSFHQTGLELLSHSNGTVISGWIIKAFPELIRRTCLIDPVCFGELNIYIYSYAQTFSLKLSKKTDTDRKKANDLIVLEILHYQLSGQ